MGRGPSIEGRKNAEDARRGKLFTKFIREITVAARVGGGDPAANPRLRLVIDKALDANMSKDTLERAIRRGTGADGNDVRGSLTRGGPVTREAVPNRTRQRCARC